MFSHSSFPEDEAPLSFCLSARRLEYLRYRIESERYLVYQTLSPGTYRKEPLAQRGANHGEDDVVDNIGISAE